jgi:pyridoxal phosphate enzyme (YggS family)
VTEIAVRLASVRERIAAACERSGRDPRSVGLVAVSKTVPAAAIADAIAAGQTVFGENRVQEALAKMSATSPDATWHLVGHLQKNKARQAAGAFALIHGIDDRELAVELDRRAQTKAIRQPVLVQANLAGESTKSGADEEGLMPLLASVAGMSHLDLRGLMIIPPAAADPEASRPWFRRLSELRERAVAHLGRPLPELSMGMTDDFEVAIEEGATLIRVGRAIFGERR